MQRKICQLFKNYNDATVHDINALTPSPLFMQFRSDVSFSKELNGAEYGFLSSVYEIITDIEYESKAKSFSAICVLKCLSENY